jgi:hypothetical protein
MSFSTLMRFLDTRIPEKHEKAEKGKMKMKKRKITYESQDTDGEAFKQ